MSSATEYVTREPVVEDYTLYRSVSFLAICASILGVMSLAAFLFIPLLVIPAAGIAISVMARRRVKQRADELSGLGWAQTGLGLSVISLVGSIGLHSFVYATEVPEGYERVSFAELQPDPARPELPISPQALELDGQKIFVRGYVYPDGQKTGIKKFILVPDMGTCCFGGQPKLTDMIEVTLRDPLRAKYSMQRQRLTGVLKVDTRKKPVSGLDGVYYQLEADNLF